MDEAYQIIRNAVGGFVVIVTLTVALGGIIALAWREAIVPTAAFIKVTFRETRARFTEQVGYWEGKFKKDRGEVTL